MGGWEWAGREGEEEEGEGEGVGCSVLGWSDREAAARASGCAGEA